ncbi:hypothetical protein BUALT_Bualt14G0094200 [Buddleja alternifolia]|uniref:DUF7081 domain-containing protein n=1 Tax=Buddleja alternifolia TaxID=168488 RepID=A0AAV6WJ80_9LAMI|nr:hypothetical protein BUALT_Bualt14G0094200 [Buddleja alternifolia]
MKIDVSEPTDRLGEDDSVKRLVRPRESGKGLPYAPVDWPSPGDVWTWKVGSRISPSGYYTHRFLIVPERLQKSVTRKIWLGSKPSIRRYLRSEFPKADIDAFFASFTWEIPAEIRSPVKVKSEPASRKADLGSQIFSRTRKSTRNCIQFTTKDAATSIDLSLSKGLSPGRVSPNCIADENDVTFDPLEDFESYLNSLDDILSRPISITANSGSALLQMEDFTKSREELSSLLAMDFPSLIASKKLPEVTNLSCKLQTDPHLSPHELSMLNLIQEMPSASKRFLDGKKVKQETREFFLELDGNIALINTLKNKYFSSKNKIAILQAEYESATSTIREIDEQIAMLQSLRSAIAEVVKRSHLKIDELKSTQKRVSNSIPKIVNEVQMANSERPEWEMKQKEAATEEAEILTKFAPLEGFSFMH